MLNPTQTDADQEIGVDQDPTTAAAAELKQQLLALADSSIYFSDLLLEAGSPVKMKGSRGWVDCPNGIVQSPMRDVLEAFIRDNMSLTWGDDMKNYGALNRSIDLANWRLRLNAYTTRGAEDLKVGIRRNPSIPPSIEEAELPASIKMMLNVPRGLILIGGPTGAGKTTTQAAMVSAIATMGAYHIVTIEDPIEYIHRPGRSIFSQREVGIDVQTFDLGVREAMRQTPDVIVIGEIRDGATAEAALLAAESGHLVIGTLHSNSTVGSIQKILSWFPGDERAPRAATLAATLIGVINQIRLPRVDTDTPIVAAETLFNHKQQISKMIAGDADKLVAALSAERPQDIAVSMADALLALIKKKLISPNDALRAVIGNGQAYEKLQRAAETKEVAA